MIDYSVGSWPGHLGKGVGKQVGILAHFLGFGLSSRLEDKMSPVNISGGKLQGRVSGSWRNGWKGLKSPGLAES